MNYLVHGLYLVQPESGVSEQVAKITERSPFVCYKLLLHDLHVLPGVLLLDLLAEMDRDFTVLVCWNKALTAP